MIIKLGAEADLSNNLLVTSFHMNIFILKAVETSTCVDKYCCDITTFTATGRHFAGWGLGQSSGWVVYREAQSNKIGTMSKRYLVNAPQERKVHRVSVMWKWCFQPEPARQKTVRIWGKRPQTIRAKLRRESERRETSDSTFSANSLQEIKVTIPRVQRIAN